MNYNKFTNFYLESLAGSSGSSHNPSMKNNLTEDNISFHDTTSHYISFHNKENKEVGKLDFNGDKLVFEGNVEESAEKFIEFLLNTFNDKIEKIEEKSYDSGWSNGYIEGNDDWY